MKSKKVLAKCGTSFGAIMFEVFLIIAYVIGTVFGYFYGRNVGVHITIDTLLHQGYLKYRGTLEKPDIIKYNEE